MKQQFFNTGLKFFKEHKLTNKTIVVAVSSGVDSVVMLDLLKKLSSPCKLQLYVGHIHHGPSSKKTTQIYRDKALQFVKKLAQSYKLEFFCPPQAKTILKNEEELRTFRHHNLKKFLKQNKLDRIALAHNKNDLLETQLLHLIRGCGMEGLKSMKVKNLPYLRPLLGWSRQDIQNYAQQNKLQWLEDPSNKNPQHVRNWIRNQWLPQLENKRAGGVQSLARSLKIICQYEQKDLSKKALSAKGIDRRFFMELPLPEQKRILALYMRKLKISNYGLAHIDEILKLTERTQKQFSAKILKKTWWFSSKYIYAK